MFAVSHLALDRCHFFRCLVTYLTNNTLFWFFFLVFMFFYYHCVLFQFCCALCASSALVCWYCWYFFWLQFLWPLRATVQLSPLTILSHFFWARHTFCFIILNISKGYSHLFLVSVVRLNSAFLQFKDCFIGFLSIFLAFAQKALQLPLLFI